MANEYESLLAPVNTAHLMEFAAAATPEIGHPTVDERAAAGKAARKRMKRKDHAHWVASDDRPDPIGLLESQAKGRIPELLPIRYGRMLASPFAFYRGGALIMASDLSSLPNTELTAQLCGDAHLSNFGGFASPERELVFDVNDFDETLPGPFEWDVKRMAASFEIAGRSRRFGKKARREIVRTAVAEYAQAMHEFAAMGNLDIWHSSLGWEGIEARWGDEIQGKLVKFVRKAAKKAYSRDNIAAFEKLTERVDGQLKFVNKPPLIVPIDKLFNGEARRGAIETMQSFIRSYRQSLPGEHRHLVEGYEYVDMARKVVGVGSVGTEAWVVLLLGRDDQDPLVLQFKEASASALSPYLGAGNYVQQGQRVVEGQQLMQAASDIFLGWNRIQREGSNGTIIRDYYVRQLWDSKLSPDVEDMDADILSFYGQLCGWALASAHARSGDSVAIAAYLGKRDKFAQALAEFSVLYADQNDRDHAVLQSAVKSGRIKAETGV